MFGFTDNGNVYVSNSHINIRNNIYVYIIYMNIVVEIEKHIKYKFILWICRQSTPAGLLIVIYLLKELFGLTGCQLINVSGFGPESTILSPFFTFSSGTYHVLNKRRKMLLLSLFFPFEQKDTRTQSLYISLSPEDCRTISKFVSYLYSISVPISAAALNR